MLLKVGRGADPVDHGKEPGRGEWREHPVPGAPVQVDPLRAIGEESQRTAGPAALVGRDDDQEGLLVQRQEGLAALGVTLDHPHGQVYGYPYVPPVVEKEIEAEHEYWLENERPLMAAVLQEELSCGERIVYENESCVAFIPSFARYPFETYVVPRVSTPSLAELDGKGLDGFAEAIQTVAKQLDGLFGFSMPYVMAMHQKPTMHGYDGSWLHVEFYPPYRTATKLKYLAGSEAGAGAFINDTLAEESAQLMRAALNR